MMAASKHDTKRKRWGYTSAAEWPKWTDHYRVGMAPESPQSGPAAGTGNHTNPAPERVPAPAKNDLRAPTTAGVIGPVFDPANLQPCMIDITSPTGVSKQFVIRRQPADANFRPGEWTLSRVWTDERFGEQHDYMFAFVDEFGIHVWRKYRSSGDKPTKFEQYARMIERASKFQRRGCIYAVTPLDDE